MDTFVFEIKLARPVQQYKVRHDYLQNGWINQSRGKLWNRILVAHHKMIKGFTMRQSSSRYAIEEPMNCSMIDLRLYGYSPAKLNYRY
jgi:hypothetical protein